MQTSCEVNQSIQSLQFSAAEAGSTDQRRLGLSLSNESQRRLFVNFITSPRVKGPTAEVVLASSSLLDASDHERDGER